MKGNSFRLD